MPGKLQHEIRQAKPFPRLEEEAVLNIVKTSDLLDQQLTAALKPEALSPTQYNVLRILRGAGEGGLPCGEIAARMISRDPDITRLLDRMEKRSLISRQRCTHDRRVVTTQITPEGLAMLERLHDPLQTLISRILGEMGQQRLGLLIELLEQVRENARQTCAAGGNTMKLNHLGEKEN